MYTYIHIVLHTLTVLHHYITLLEQNETYHHWSDSHQAQAEEYLRRQLPHNQTFRINGDPLKGAQPTNTATFSFSPLYSSCGLLFV